MAEAKIEIVAKPIKGFEGAKDFAPHHLYILITMSNGDRIAIRGGPAGGDAARNWIADDLKVTKLPYDQKHPDWETVDVAHSKHLLAKGDDVYINSLVSNPSFQKTFNEINTGRYDYKVAIPFISWGSWQNSNTVARVVTEAMGLKFELPKIQDLIGGFRPVWAPGFDHKLGHTFVDQALDKRGEFIEWYAKEYKTTIEAAKEVFTDLSTKFKAAHTEYVKEGYSVTENQKHNSKEDHSSPAEAFQSTSDSSPDDGPHLMRTDRNAPSPTPSPDPGSWFDPWTRDFWPKPEPTLSEKKKDLFQSYKSAFPKKPIFDLENPFSRNKLVNEPLSLYAKGGDPTNALFQRSINEYNLMRDLQNSVKSCLGNPACTDTVSTLIHKASNTYGAHSSPSFMLQSEMKNAAGDAARSFFLSESLLSSLRNSAELGSWSHPLRNELKYAASHVSPLVLDLNGDEIKLLPYTKGVYFDIDADGFAERVGWPSPEDGQLARDLNQNGSIDDITELFGDDQISAFFKLSLLDSNDDKVIDENDEDFKELLIWQDKNLNGYSEPEELKTLGEMGIKSISLSTQPDDRVIEGNRISATSTFTYANGSSGEVADVHYHNDDMDSWYKGEKASYKSDDDQYSEDRERFRQEVFEKLSERIKNPDNVDKTSDWVGDLVRSEADRYIAEFHNRKNSELKKLLDKVNALNTNKKVESKKVCADENERLEKEANERFIATKQEAKAKLLEEIQGKLDQDKENINSRYTQAYLAEKEALLNNINVGLQAANKATHQTATQGRWTQQQYNQAVAANKANFERELKTQQEAAGERHAKAAAEERDKLTEQYTNEYKERLDKISEGLKQTETSKLVEKTHEHHQSCVVEEKGIKSVLVDQYRKNREAAKKSIEEFEKAIKQEGNSVYEFFTSKVIQQAAFSEAVPAPETHAETESNTDTNSNSKSKAEKHSQDSTKSDTDNSEENSQNSKETNKKEKISEVSDWLKDEFFTSQQDNNTRNGDYHSDVKIDPETLFMPLMRGHGKIPALHIAMTDNAKLKDLVVDFMGLKPAAFADIYGKIVNILYEWAGVSGIAEDARAAAGGANIEARKVAFIEQLTGQEFKQLGAAKFVGQHASTAVQRAWDIALMRATKHLLIQGPFIPLFPNGEYSFVDDNTKLNSTLAEILSVSKDFAANHTLGYDFWVQLGYILVLSANELNSNIDEINGKLTELAGEPVMLDISTFGLIGDDKPNIIRGSSGSDYIKGLGGNDKLYGREGSDHIEGDEGDDELYGDQGIDRMYGGDGNDKMYGGEGRDFMYGGDGNDEIHGEEGDDHIEGGEGADDMDGGEGVNTLSYGSSPEGVYVSLEPKEGPEKTFQEARQTGHASGDKFKNFQNIGGSEYNDHLVGDDRDNHINGEGGDDLIEGLGGDDHLFGATGNDQLVGGEGDDVLTGFEGPDHMDGGEGQDTVSYNHPYATRGVKVNLLEGKGVGGHAHDDTFKNIENVRGSKHNDVIQGNNDDNILQGMGGDDIIYGEGGDDVIVGGSGEDKLFGEAGDDRVLLTGDGDYADGGEGEDTVSYEFASEPVVVDMASGTGSTTIINEDRFEGFENAWGSQFDDEITGDDKNNKLLGLEGNDVIRGGKGDDTIIGGEGDDKLYGEEGDDRIIGDEGKDEIDGGEGADIVDYSNEPNTGIKVDLEKGTAKGGIAQGDTLKNIEGVVGTEFDDLLIGDDENNFLFGGAGNDQLEGGDGNDQLSGGPGNNTLDGGLGVDLASYTWSQEGVNINLSEGKSSKEGTYEDVYIDIEGVIGSKHNDTIIGDDKNNYLYGGEGDDYINGGAWNDKISGGKGNNILEGGKGSDEFLLVEGSNKVDGGDGEDTVSYEAYNEEDYRDVHSREFAIRSMNNLLPQYPGQGFTTPAVPSIAGLVINLATAIVEKPGGLVDEFINVENAIGTHFDDTIIGDDNNNELIGTNGNDKIYGGKGDDKIVCGWGASDLYGEEGNDIFIIGGFPTNIDGGEGVDSADFINLPVPIEGNLKDGYVLYKDAAGIIRSKLEHVEDIRGTNFDDVLYDTDGDNIIAGGKGNDKIYLTNGDDSVNGQAGKDTIYLGGGGNKQIWGGGVDDDTFVITKDFKTQNKTSTIIVDFDVGVAEDKIDLRAFSHLKNMEDLHLEQIMHDNKKFAVISIDQEKWISLYNINIDTLDPSNFIFASDEAQATCDLAFSQEFGHF